MIYNLAPGKLWIIERAQGGRVVHRYALGEHAFVRSLTIIRRRLDPAVRSSVLLVGVLLLALPRIGDAAPEGRNCSPEPTDMFIDYGDLINCGIDVVGDIDVLRFTGGSGETIRIQISGAFSGFTRPCFELFDPGALPVGDPICANSRADFVLDRSGTHTVLISENGNDFALSYALLLERIGSLSATAAPIQSNQVIEEDIDVGDADIYFLAGTLGDTIRVQISGAFSGFTRPCFEFFDPEFLPLAEPVCANSSADFLLQETGVYTVVVTENGFDFALPYQLSHACILGTCADTNIRPLQASGCLDAKGVPLTDRVVRLTQPNERRKSTRTDVRGCFAFDVVRGKPYELEVAGPDVPE